MKKLIAELEAKGIKLAGLFDEPAFLYSGRDDDFNFVTVWVMYDL